MPWARRHSTGWPCAWALRAAPPCFRRSPTPVLSIQPADGERGARSRRLLLRAPASGVDRLGRRPARYRHDPAAGSHPGAPERARQKNRARHGAGGTLNALVFLTNIPGSMALALAVFCWICAQPRDRLRAAWRVAATASALAYGVACFGVPPSSMFRVGANVGDMHHGFSNSLHY